MDEGLMSKENNNKFFKNTPVLIYGPRKGGTTLLQNLIDGSSSLLVRPLELKIKYIIQHNWDSIRDAQEYLQEENRIINSTITTLIDYSSYTNMISNFCERNIYDYLNNDMKSLYNSIKSKKEIEKPLSWAAKEVGGDTKMVLAFWRLIFGFNAKIVLIIRDPKMITRSIITDRKRRLNKKISFVTIIKEIFESVRNIFAQIEYLSKSNTLIICYENLIYNVDNTMRDICRFLNINFSNIHTKTTILGEEVYVSTASKKVKGVFVSKKKWYNDLSFIEIATVYIFNKIFFIYYSRKYFDKYKIKINSYNDILSIINELRK
jgi:hypothetical protein